MQYNSDVEIGHGTWNINTLNGMGLEICDELWKRNVDLCGLQEVRWRGRWVRLIGLHGRNYKLWWSRNQEEHSGVGVLVREELYNKVAEE